MLRPLVTPAVVLAALAATVRAQDLQPGRNFPTASAAFGAGRSENLDVGDVDADGDLDVLVANGGDGTAQQNRLYVNVGGLQGGLAGAFSDRTSPQLAPGAPNGRSRDCELVDLEGDGDLDAYVSNRGGSITGEVSRFFDNDGGGFFVESTDVRWGDLVSVPAGDQVLGGDHGPWLDWSCDCDFGDLDNDGDLDLFHSAYGPNISGTRESRVFLNDGAGEFDEHWPWLSGPGDVTWHTLDIDLADFDGDFDLDVAVSSRNSQARFFENRVEDDGALAWRDVTQTAFLDGGLGLVGQSNYEAEYADLDGDGDFDIWFKNLVGLADAVARNDGGLSFTYWDPIVNDPEVDENEVDVIDYDGDGDLDAFVANFAGTNWLYRSTLAQGGPLELRRTDAGGEPGELPTIGNGGTTLDGEVADVDGDGDPDLLLANDGNQQNRLFLNQLGVPDTHAPGFAQVEVVPDRPDGTAARVVAQVRDNSPYYIVAFCDVDLVWSLDGGFETRLDMVAQGGQQFVAFLPGDVQGCVRYRVEATDLAGNTGVSQTFAFVQGGGTCASPWTDLGQGKPGTGGVVPQLVGTGDLAPGSANAVELAGAPGPTGSTLVVGTASIEAPFKGGTLVPAPTVLVPVPVGADGTSALPFTWPASAPSGVTLFWQQWVVDAGASGGLSASNALRSDSP